jgi:hypothetical protein
MSRHTTREKECSMKLPKTLAALTCLVSAIGLATASSQEQTERREDDGRCREIRANLATAIATDNCPSPIHLCAAGVITGDQLLRGTTFASVLGLAPSIGLPGIEPETNVSLAGERTITTSHGTLTFRFITVFDTTRGEFAEIERVTGGTESFERATGTLWAIGTGTTVFEGRITGQICTHRR